MNFSEYIKNNIEKSDAEKLIVSFNNKAFSSFKLNSFRNGNFIDYIENNALRALKHVKNAYYFNKEINELGKFIEFYGGAYYIQEASAMLVSEIIDINENDKVLDMCAAPGGKSFNLLNKLNNTGILVCNDINPLRSRILSSTIEKYGFKNAIVLNENSKKYKKNFVNYFDKIILDAPCSGSGMFRKDENSITTWSIDKVYECASIQKELIEDAYMMLKPGGKMIYSTCSYSKEENEDIISEFIAKHNDMSIINIELNKLYSNTLNPKGGLRLYPFKYDGEGQVMYLLEKKSEDYKENRFKELVYSKNVKLVYEFLDSIKYNYKKEKIVKIKDQFYLADFNKIDILDLNILRYGLHLGYIENNRFIPSHSLAMVFDINNSVKLELNKKEAVDYLQGLQINDYKTSGNGFKVVTYNNYPLGFVKQNGTTLKNHLPKGLKLSINLIK